MTKELSIKSIKKDIIEKILNNMDVLKYLKAGQKVTDGINFEKFYNNFIFDHDSSRACGDYISVEVSEYDSHRAINVGDRVYMVTIKMGLEEEENVCAMSAVITDIVNKLYPGRRRFSNVPFITVDNCMSVNNYGGSFNYPVLNTISLENKRNEQLNRMITFEIEN